MKNPENPPKQSTGKPKSQQRTLASILEKKKRTRHVDFDETIGNRDGDDSAAGDAALVPRILGQNPGKALVRKEIREHISIALSELSENHRAVLVMRELEGLSYQEMAEVMKQLRQRVSRA